MLLALYASHFVSPCFFFVCARLRRSVFSAFGWLVSLLVCPLPAAVVLLGCALLGCSFSSSPDWRWLRGRRVVLLLLLLLLPFCTLLCFPTSPVSTRFLPAFAPLAFLSGRSFFLAFLSRLRLGFRVLGISLWFLLRSSGLFSASLAHCLSGRSSMSPSSRSRLG